MRKRILKTILTIVLLLIIGGCIYIISMDFRWSDKKFARELDKSEVDGEIIYTEFDNIKMRTVHAGDRMMQPVVFIHGAPGSSKDFARYLKDPELKEASFLMSVDRPGYGFSDYGKFMPSIRSQALAVSACIPDSSIIVGHSYGGPVASAIAMYAPEKAKEIILLAPAVDPEFEKHFAVNRLMGFPAVKWTLSGALKVALDEKMSHEQSLEEIMADWDKITVPVTVVHGMSDNIVPVENTAFLERVLVNAELEIHNPEEMNHIMIWTEYEWVKNVLLEKLNLAVRPDNGHHRSVGGNKVGDTESQQQLRPVDQFGVKSR